MSIAKTWRTFAKLMCFRDKILGQFQGLKIHDWQLIYINYYQCIRKSRTKTFQKYSALLLYNKPNF